MAMRASRPQILLYFLQVKTFLKSNVQIDAELGRVLLNADVVSTTNEADVAISSSQFVSTTALQDGGQVNWSGRGGVVVTSEGLANIEELGRISGTAAGHGIESDLQLVSESNSLLGSTATGDIVTRAGELLVTSTSHSTLATGQSAYFMAEHSVKIQTQFVQSTANSQMIKSLHGNISASSQGNGSITIVGHGSTNSSRPNVAFIAPGGQVGLSSNSQINADSATMASIAASMVITANSSGNAQLFAKEKVALRSDSMALSGDSLAISSNQTVSVNSAGVIAFSAADILHVIAEKNLNAIADSHLYLTASDKVRLESADISVRALQNISIKSSAAQVVPGDTPTQLSIQAQTGCW